MNHNNNSNRRGSSHKDNALKNFMKLFSAMQNEIVAASGSKETPKTQSLDNRNDQTFANSRLQQSSLSGQSSQSSQRNSLNEKRTKEQTLKRIKQNRVGSNRNIFNKMASPSKSKFLADRDSIMDNSQRCPLVQREMVKANREIVISLQKQTDCIQTHYREQSKLLTTIDQFRYRLLSSIKHAILKAN